MRRICTYKNKHDYLVIARVSCFSYALEIPYSVSVVSSMNFSFTVMPFDEPRSYAALQRICDCLLIKRIQAQSNMQSIIQGIIEQYSHFQTSNMFCAIYSKL